MEEQQRLFPILSVHNGHTIRRCGDHVCIYWSDGDAPTNRLNLDDAVKWIDDVQYERVQRTIVLPMMRDGDVRYFPMWRYEKEEGYRFYMMLGTEVSYAYADQAEQFNKTVMGKNSFGSWET